ncbi:hypothetical protein [Novosphingobium sp.]|uniref:hypothetical protein n=1 Tax=Novosphingobium sp. TaxID=1874826 RepID=UPI001D20FAD4|nr:hypothetical protein [Novosphingobium sp.]MBX9664032.1 hypothetical protein [Novosphingobium sp.]
MLLFIDEPRNIKIVRQPPEGGIREPLCKVKKQQLAISDEVAGQLKDEELVEIEAAFNLLAEGETARIKAAIAAFPSTIREVLGYYKDGASAMEQRWILGALLEGLRLIRRHDRETGI